MGALIIMSEATFQYHLYESREFADVTLVSDDYFSIDVHKTILAHSSSIFRSLLLLSTDHKPLIFLKGVYGKDLSSLVKLIYLGESLLENDELQAVSAVAEEYQIQKFSSNHHLLNLDAERKPNQKLDFLTKSPLKETKTNKIMNSNKLTFLNFEEDTEEKDKKENYYSNTDEKPDINMSTETSDNSSEIQIDHDFGDFDNLETNIEENNAVNDMMDDNSLEDEESKSDESETKKRRKKEEEPSECNVCARKFTTLRSMQRHHKTIHELSQIAKCNQCDKSFTSKDGLRGHIRGVHEPPTFMTCQNCNQQVRGSTPFIMKKHRQRCLKLICEFCKIRFTEEQEFNLHIRQQHIEKYMS